MRESGAQGQGAGDFNLGGEAGEVRALKRGVLGNQSEGESAGRRVSWQRAAMGTKRFWAESRRWFSL